MLPTTNALNDPGPIFFSAIVRHYVSDLLPELEADDDDFVSPVLEVVDLSGFTVSLLSASEGFFDPSRL